VKLYKGKMVSALKLLLKVTPEFEGIDQVEERLRSNTKIRNAAFQGMLLILPAEQIDISECSTGMVKRKIDILGEDRL